MICNPVNDSPPLKKVNVGIAVEGARDAAQGASARSLQFWAFSFRGSRLDKLLLVACWAQVEADDGESSF